MAKVSVRKKTTKAPAIRRSSSKTLEEKHIGREVTDWSEVTEAKVYECLRHYGYFYDNKDSVRWATAWVKKNMTKANLTHFSAAEDWRISLDSWRTLQDDAEWCSVWQRSYGLDQL
jgi:outer membrane protease